jgi:anti-sigma regulatory factor (Ser/Thr protein kinase)
MKIHLPNSAFLGNIDPFLKGFDPSNPNELEITANKKWMFIHPVILSMIASLGLTLNPSNIILEKLEATSKHYLERMELFKFLGISSGIKINKHESSGRFIPLTQITNSTDLTNFIREMVPFLHLEQQRAQSIKYIISELVRNVLEHAQSKYGAIVSAQYYKKSNSIRIGIADTGVGIRKTINESHYTKDDLEAIRLALIPGITGTTSKEGGTELNAGAGLFFVKSIAAVNHSHFMIYSGHAMYKLLKNNHSKKTHLLHADPFYDKHSKKHDLPYWQGTIVGIDISLDMTETFSLLLDLIRDTYTKAVKERKQAKYRRAKFI